MNPECIKLHLFRRKIYTKLSYAKKNHDAFIITLHSSELINLKFKRLTLHMPLEELKKITLIAFFKNKHVYSSKLTQHKHT